MRAAECAGGTAATKPIASFECQAAPERHGQVGGVGRATAEDQRSGNSALWGWCAACVYPRRSSAVGSMRCVSMASQTTHTVERGSKPLQRPAPMSASEHTTRRTTVLDVALKLAERGVARLLPRLEAAQTGAHIGVVATRFAARPFVTAAPAERRTLQWESWPSSLNHHNRPVCLHSLQSKSVKFDCLLKKPTHLLKTQIGLDSNHNAATQDWLAAKNDKFETRRPLHVPLAATKCLENSPANSST